MASCAMANGLRTPVWRVFRRGYRSTSGAIPSSLGASFNAKPQIAKAARGSTASGLFGIEELTSFHGFGEMREECLVRADRLVDEACSPHRKRLITQVFDDLSDELCKVADLAEFVRLAHPEADMASAAEDACISISGLVEKLNTDVKLYGALKRVVQEGDSLPETAVDKHVGRLFLLDFEQCGIHLNDSDRSKVVRLNDEILQIGQQFAAGCQQPSVVAKADVADNLRHLFHQDKGMVILNGLLVDSSNEEARKSAYKLYYKHSDDQEHLLRLLLERRHSLAQLCDFPTFAHRATLESLASSPETVNEFLHDLSKELKSRVELDFQLMLNLKKRSNPMAKSLEVWDVPYLSSQAKRVWFDLSSSSVSEYFSLGTCMEGLNTIFKALFSVELVVEEPLPGETWHPDVYKVCVRELNGADLGHIYCDFFSRPGKPHQDCHFTIRGGRQLADGSYQNPVVVLMLSLPSPGWNSPTLLSSGMVDNLFHEMGHAMHSMLARTKYQHVTGTRCSTDFAEVPSTLMEYFSSDPRILSQMGRHYKTGEPLPEQVVDKYCASKRLFCAADLHTQLLYSILDQRYHGGHPPACSTGQTLADVHQHHHVLPFPTGAEWQHRFSHLVGYGARYYSYLMARSVASSIWQQYFEADPLNSEGGAKYRRECLAHGGGKPSHSLVSDFLGRSVKPEHLAEALVKEIDTKNDLVSKRFSEASA